MSTMYHYCAENMHRVPIIYIGLNVQNNWTACSCFPSMQLTNLEFEPGSSFFKAHLKKIYKMEGGDI